jgi:hypothetical protein
MDMRAFRVMAVKKNQVTSFQILANKSILYPIGILIGLSNFKNRKLDDISTKKLVFDKISQTSLRIGTIPPLLVKINLHQEFHHGCLIKNHLTFEVESSSRRNSRSAGSAS